MPVRTYVPLQAWICEKCLCAGHVEAPANLTSEQVMLRIHDQHIEIDPACAANWGVQYVRVAEASPLSEVLR